MMSKKNQPNTIPQFSGSRKYDIFKSSFFNLGVICENEADTAKLLRADNINQEKLFEYAREAADFATEYQMPHLDFAVNHYGKPDVAMFDFTSMFQVHI